MLQNRIVLNTLVSQPDHNAGVAQPELVTNLLNTNVTNIELRREYGNQTLSELQKLSQIRADHRLTFFYSVPDNLFIAHKLNLHLLQYVAEAQLLGASYIKMTLGDFDHSDAHLVDSLLSLIPESIQLNIENDQSAANSDTKKLAAFFDQFNDRSRKIGFVNDLGNWIFTHQDAETSAQALLPYTRFVHLKSYLLDDKQQPATVSFTKGDLNWKRLLNLFDTTLPVALEYPADSQALVADLAVLKQF